MTIAPPRYTELHCTSNFSFLQGGSHPEELVTRAAALGYEALALTDRATLTGIVRAHAAAKQAGLKLVIGARLEPLNAAPIIVWAASAAGYANLCRLLTHGYAQAAEADAASDANDRELLQADDDAAPPGRAGRCLLTCDDIARHAHGLLAGLPLAAAAPGCHSGLFDDDRLQNASQHLAHWRWIFEDRLWALAEVAREGDDAERLAWFGRAAEMAGVPIAAAGDVRYHERSRLPLFDVLTAVRHGSTVEGIRGRLLSNGERHLQERWRIAEQFAALPGAIERAAEIAAACTFSLDELKYEYPPATVPPGRSPREQLAHLAWTGARKRYPGGIPEKVRELVDRELALIAELGYEAYFLTVFDIVRFARRRGILCQGRGSAANSAVCYCLGITSVDPARMNVLFERFVSRERCEAPDIDVDFEHHRREEVIQYIYETYGRDRAAMTAEVISYRLRSATRDVGKALGLSLDRVDKIAGVLDVGDSVAELPTRLAEAGLDPASDTGTRLVSLVGQLVGFPRHLGQHVGGMVMTRGRLTDLVPVQPATMPGRTIVQWDKNDLDELGILKVDCLALGMLTAIHRAFDLVAEAGGPRLTLATVPAEDPTVYEMISRADTVGVFQIESRAQMSMLPRLKPRCFYDLVIEVAIVRPGPIQGDMVHPYLRRRAGEEPVTYPNDAIREVLEKTLGVPLFQEQAMRLAVVAAGFTPGEADQLRRAMGAWRRPGLIDEFHKKLVSGMLARGLSRDFAEHVFNQIRGFGEYGFPESHAASFALLVYVSAWLKRHHPAAFTAALLGSQPMGFYAPAQLIRDARAHGVEVLPADVNASDWHATTEGGIRAHETPDPASGGTPLALRLGLEQVSGLGEAEAERIVAARRDGLFRRPRDLCRRAGLDREAVLHLARAGGLASLGLSRRQAIWEAMQRTDQPTSQPLLNGLDDDDLETDTPGLEPMTPQEEVVADYRTGGLSLAGHPLAFERERLAAEGVVELAAATAAPEGRRVRVAGIALCRQRPATAKGMIFLTIEDETAAANIVVRPDVWTAADHAARRAAVLMVEGRIQRRGEVVHIVATRLTSATETAPALPRMARDFC
ncbi:MAG: error-prone DNA polymerase [Planctomycetota bacterium]|jgi:error-prone DNA polymerase|nr:error-prone DNA polymerase [Planctomycetota bacterium]MDA1202036.1 error-prone DNA polymerase [Planctomycetota bacterium]